MFWKLVSLQNETYFKSRGQTYSSADLSTCITRDSHRENKSSTLGLFRNVHIQQAHQELNILKFMNCKLQNSETLKHISLSQNKHPNAATLLIIVVLMPGHRNIPVPSLFQCQETWLPSPPETCEAVQWLIIHLSTQKSTTDKTTDS